MPERSHVKLDFRADGEELAFRRHSFGQGGHDDIAFTPPVIERLRLLRPEVIRLFVQEYFDMMPGVGVYRWTTIDPAVAAIVECGATPLLALCMKPACLFPSVDLASLVPTDWEAWEDFIEAAARHFSQERGWKGIWYEAGNEPDIGGGAPYVFGREGAAVYAEYYERTVRAVLRGDPTAKVGGPALATPRPFEHEITHELVRRVQANDVPLDFFSWHSYNVDPAAHQWNLEHALAGLRKAGEPFASAISMINEWNSTPVCNVQVGEYRQSAFLADVLVRYVQAGLDYSCYYHTMNIDLHRSKWASWYPADALDALAAGFSSHHGLHFIAQDGTPSLPYIAFRMLSRMDGRAVGYGQASDSIQYTATTRDTCCRVLVSNYAVDACARGEVRLDLRGLPDQAIRETVYSLSGYTTAGAGMLEVRAARQGEMSISREQTHPPGQGVSTTIECLPFSVHLLEFAW
jgi:xylan 1,4-beta-xylosidase